MLRPTSDPYIRTGAIHTATAPAEAMAVVREYLTRRQQAHCEVGSDGTLVAQLGSRLGFRLLGVRTGRLPTSVTARASDHADQTRVELELASDQGWYVTGLLPMAERAYRQFYDSVIEDLRDLLDGQTPGGLTQLR